MKFHGIEMRGKFWIHRVSNISSHPHGGATDEGRMVYDTTNDKFYIGSESGWVQIITQTVEGTGFGTDMGDSDNRYGTIYATTFDGSATAARYS